MEVLFTMHEWDMPLTEEEEEETDVCIFAHN